MTDPIPRCRFSNCALIAAENTASRPLESFIAQHHRRNLRKVLNLNVVTVEKCAQAEDYVDDFVNVYDTLKAKHSITGMVAFSRNSFTKQLQVPGIVAFRAVYRGETIGMLLWYVQGEVGYYHLGAYSPLGYELNASFALFAFVIEHFAAIGLRWLNLGASSGISSDKTDGLTRFKKGWSTDTKTAYFCGRIFDRQRYKEIVDKKGISYTNFFPAYRYGEF